MKNAQIVQKTIDYEFESVVDGASLMKLSKEEEEKVDASMRMLNTIVNEIISMPEDEVSKKIDLSGLFSDPKDR